MKNLMFIICIIFLMISCVNKKSDFNDRVELIILNNEINTIVMDSNVLFKEDLIYSEEVKQYAKNIINYKIKNNSERDYFFTFDEDVIVYDNFNVLQNTESCLFCKKSKLFYNIISSKNTKPKYISFYSQNINLLYEINTLKTFEKKKIEKTLKELEVPIIDFDIDFSNTVRTKSFIVPANETRFFSSILYLPIEYEVNEYNERISYFQFQKKMSYYFNIILISDSSSIRKVLSNSKLKEIEENGYIIFDGVLESNKVPVKLIPFEDKKTKVLKSQED